MNLSFTKLKNAGLPKASAKFASLTKAPKLPKISIKQPKVTKANLSKSFDFSKMTKVAKLPKTPKVSIIKRAIKKVKNVRFA
jgi:hypothetical protein